METRASKRKAEAATAALLPQNQPPKKKRVVLGELTNLSNILHSEVLAPWSIHLKPKSEAQPKANKATGKAKRTIVTKRTTEDLKVEDPRSCASYASDIDDYLLQLEKEVKRRPLSNYFDKVQQDITPNMRGMLVDWMVEVALEYRLLPETLFLSVSYIDRYLSFNVVNRQRLQLLGVSTMLIASKYEEIKPPSLEKFCDITANTYTKDQVVKMEADILSSLKFELGSPTILSFLQRFSVVALDSQKGPNLQFEFLCRYLSELSLLDFACVKFLPSLVAASVLFLVIFTLFPKREPWNTKLGECTGYQSADLKECVLVLHDLYLGRRGGSFQAIRDKYKQHKFKFVALLPSPPEVPLSFF